MTQENFSKGVTHVDLREGIREAQTRYRTIFYREDGAVHDRGRTEVGASEISKCARRFAYERGRFDSNAGTEPHDFAGYFDRGDAVEWKSVERLRQALSLFGLELMMAGEAQRTIVRTPLSATPDGVIVNRTGKDVHFPLDDGDIYLKSGASCVVEFKSVRPAAHMSRPKPKHVLQTQIQIALVNLSKDNQYEPLEGVIIYTDCSDFNRRAFFKVEQPDPGFIATQEQRAQALLDCDDPKDALAEGRYTGECDSCPFSETCTAATIRYMPHQETPISDNAVVHFDYLAQRRFDAMERIEDLEMEKKRNEEELRKMLVEHDTRRAQSDHYSVTWTTIKPSKRLVKPDRITALHPEVKDDPDCWRMTEEGHRLTVRRKHS